MKIVALIAAFALACSSNSGQQQPSPSPGPSAMPPPTTPPTEPTPAPPDDKPTEPTPAPPADKPTEPKPVPDPKPTTPDPKPVPDPKPKPPAGAGKLHDKCGANDACEAPAACVKYYGIAGPRGPEFKTCEIKCDKKATKCPTGTTCGIIADGPGQVCR